MPKKFKKVVKKAAPVETPVHGPIKLVRTFGVSFGTACAGYPSAKNRVIREGTLIRRPTDDEFELVGAGFAEEVTL